MLVLYEQTRIAATRLVWIVVILNSIKDSGLISNSQAVQIKSFGGQKGANPPCLRAWYDVGNQQRTCLATILAASVH